MYAKGDDEPQANCIICQQGSTIATFGISSSLMPMDKIYN